MQQLAKFGGKARKGFFDSLQSRDLSISALLILLINFYLQTTTSQIYTERIFTFFPENAAPYFKIRSTPRAFRSTS